MDFEAYWGLKDRDWARSGVTLAEGATLVRRLLASKLTPEAVLCLPAHEAEFSALAAGRCEVKVLSPKEMDKWAGFAFHRGVVAVARRPAPLTLEQFLAGSPAPRRLAVAPNLTDPENLGSVFRSALALGWDAVAVGPSTCDPYSRRTAKVSMGAVYAHPPVELPDPEATGRLLSEAGWTSVALALEPEAVDLEAWLAGEGRAAVRGPLAAWVGNEFEGLSPVDRAACTTALVIPMALGHDSLNAAVAASLAFYRLRRADFG
jgi:tRNA G18 (ribose-2'-O)-methylase SpoU